MILENNITGIRIGVYTLPQRTKPCLCVEKGNCLTKYATFNNDLAANDFMEILAEFVGARNEETER